MMHGLMIKKLLMVTMKWIDIGWFTIKMTTTIETAWWHNRTRRWINYNKVIIYPARTLTHPSIKRITSFPAHGCRQQPTNQPHQGPQYQACKQQGETDDDQSQLKIGQ